jgi:hypothetical protein
MMIGESASRNTITNNTVHYTTRKENVNQDIG